MGRVTFNNSNNQFFQSLKRSVEEYFENRKIKKTGNWELYTKTIVLIPAALAIYVSLLFISMPAALGIFLCAVLGAILSSIGFNIMHDACHGSYSSKKFINNTLGLTLNAMGGNAFFWKQKHNIIHHTYTNIDGIDDDIAQGKILRQTPTQEWLPVHKYQHIYLTFAYGFMLFSWVLYNDFKRYFTRKIHTTKLQKMSTSEHVVFWTSKVLYAFFYIALPIILVGPIAWLIGYIVLNVVTGIMISYVFQLAHTVEGPEFEVVGIADKYLESEWAVHQIRTTANFAPKSKILSWFCGGLNYQIEHHLFPRISHVHYPALSEIVREHCMRFQLPYHTFPTLGLAVSSHIRTMKQLGRKPE